MSAFDLVVGSFFAVREKKVDASSAVCTDTGCACYSLIIPFVSEATLAFSPVYGTLLSVK